jgi:hypothetical protein
MAHVNVRNAFASSRRYSQTMREASIEIRIEDDAPSGMTNSSSCRTRSGIQWLG